MSDETASEANDPSRRKGRKVESRQGIAPFVVPAAPESAVDAQKRQRLTQLRDSAALEAPPRLQRGRAAHRVRHRRNLRDARLSQGELHDVPGGFWRAHRA